MPKSTCTQAACDSLHYSRGLCALHYRHAKRDGCLPAKLTHTERFWAKVDKSGDCWEWTAYRNGDGYGKFQYPGVGQIAHRISYQLLVGPIPDDMHVDHMCHNRGCVNPAHLRACTVKQNRENLRGAHRNSKSGVLGVCWREDANKWHVTVKHNDKSRHVGYYRTLEEAEAASFEARAKLFTHFQTTDRAGK